MRNFAFKMPVGMMGVCIEKELVKREGQFKSTCYVAA
jgi:hypothetical protein